MKGDSYGRCAWHYPLHSLSSDTWYLAQTGPYYISLTRHDTRSSQCLFWRCPSFLLLVYLSFLFFFFFPYFVFQPTFSKFLPPHSSHPFDRLCHQIYEISPMSSISLTLILCTTVQEAKYCDIPTIGLIDSDTDPSSVMYPVPGNDDSHSSITFFLSHMVKAVQEGKVSLPTDSVERVAAHTHHKPWVTSSSSSSSSPPPPPPPPLLIFFFSSASYRLLFLLLSLSLP